MARAVNVELTPTYEAAAVGLLGDSGLADRAERKIMDFAEAGDKAEAADVVVMNRAICCYSDMPKLAGPAAQHAKEWLPLSFPNAPSWTPVGLSFAPFG